MKQFRGIWLPDTEEHLETWMTANDVRIDGRATYQWHKQLECYKFLDKQQSKMRTAVDAGAHIGLWSMHMAKRFKAVEAFEPVKEHRACFLKNTAEYFNIRLWPTALGDALGSATIVEEPGSSGGAHLDDFAARLLPALTEEDRVPVAPLDSIGLADVDFIKIDCEGYESKVCLGGEQLIRQYRPVMMVEHKKNMNERYESKSVVRLLEEWGASIRYVYSGDYLMAW